MTVATGAGALAAGASSSKLLGVRIPVKHTSGSDRGGLAGYGRVILGRLKLTERARRRISWFGDVVLIRGTCDTHKAK